MSASSEVGVDIENVELEDEIIAVEEIHTPQKRRKGTTSMVCDQFIECTDDDPNSPHAKCKYCGAKYSCHSKRNETCSMKVHLETCCKEYPCRSSSNSEMKEDASEKKESGGDSESVSSCRVFNLDNARKLVVEMLITDEVPLNFVEAEGFKRFIDRTLRRLEPSFVLPSITSAMKDVLDIYEREKEALKEFFRMERFRVSLTIDTWTSAQNINFMVLIAHFIDSEWKMHKRVLNFRRIEDHEGETIGKEVERCLKQWGIVDKVLTLAVNNVSSSDMVITYLVKHFSNELLLNGDFLHVRCWAHIMNLIVSDGLKDINESVHRIRNIVRFVKSCPEHFAKFKSCVQKENISSKRRLCLDVPTIWNSTYLMLEAAEKFEKAFDRLEEYNRDYRDEDTPSTGDWEVARIFVQFLAVFNEVTSRLSGSLCVTANVVFCETSYVQRCIKKYLNDSDNLVLHDMATKMQTKYDKYWGNSEDVNTLLYVAVALDPRYKLKYLSYCFQNLFDANVANEISKKTEKCLRLLFDEYNVRSSSEVNAGQSSTSQIVSVTEPDYDSFDEKFEMYGGGDDILCTEIDVYLLEARLRFQDNFDILQWWKSNSSRFKILSKIAQDILAIPVSTVVSKTAFSTARRNIDLHRTSVSPKIVEALICTQSWLNEDDKREDVMHEEDEDDAF